MRSLRKGYSLIELLAVMSVFSVTLTHHRADAAWAAEVRRPTCARQHGHRHPTGTIRAPIAYGCPCGTGVRHAVPPTMPTPPPTVLQLTLPDQQIVEYRLQTDQHRTTGAQRRHACNNASRIACVPVLQQGMDDCHQRFTAAGHGLPAAAVGRASRTLITACRRGVWMPC